MDVGHGARVGGCGLAVAVGAEPGPAAAQPAATYYTVLHVDENGHQDGYTAVMAAKAGRESMTVGAANGRVEVLDSISYYTNSDPLTLENSAKLRYICTYGPHHDHHLSRNGSWNWVSPWWCVARLPRRWAAYPAAAVGRGTAWCSRVTNNSRTALDNGVILTDYGFVTVGDLLPSQTAEKGPLRPCLRARRASGTAMKPLATVCC